MGNTSLNAEYERTYLEEVAKGTEELKRELRERHLQRFVNINYMDVLELPMQGPLTNWKHLSIIPFQVDQSRR